MRSVRLCVLSSGSGGNCLWVEAGGTRALFDAGLPLRETARRCAQAGISLRDVSDVFLTHEHADHAGGAGVLGRKLGVRVHATRGTFRELRDLPPPELRRPLRAGVAVALPGLRVMPLAVPHDAREPVAYRFGDGAVSAALVTDLGCAPPPLVRSLRGLDALVLEMNHDLHLLLDGPYPWSLKKRIRGDFGHLSNEQGAALLGQVLHAGLKHVMLAHLSEHNNSADHARRAAEDVLARHGASARLAVASQVCALEPLSLQARQLVLFA
jgi:phosphoribosyl 1,2-cyclic phosphodiesterase